MAKLYNYNPRVGDVIEYKDIKYVVIEAHCTLIHNTYRGEYRGVELDQFMEHVRCLDSNKYTTYNDLEDMSKLIWIHGDDLKKFTPCKGEAPFQLKTLEVVKIRRKVPKQVIVYE